MLAVMAFHIWPDIFSGGYIGVDIFFVISGFLITSLIMSELQTGHFSFAGFWERRARRILPALIFVCCVTAALGWFVLVPFDYKNLGAQLFSQSLFASNFLFAFQSGYFDAESASKPLLHTWSLAVEEQFYLLYPFLIVWLFKNYLKHLPRFLGGCIVLSVMCSIAGSMIYSAAAFYLLPVRAWELLLGAVVACTTLGHFAKFERLVLCLLGILAVILPLLFFASHETHMWLVMLVPCVGTALLLWLGKDQTSFIHAALASAPLRGIGLISYSLYLWHWPLLVLAHSWVGDQLPLQHILVLLGAIFVLSYLTWQVVEKPFRHKTLCQSRQSMFVAALAGLGVISLLGAALYLTSGMPGRLSVQTEQFAAVLGDVSPRQIECRDRTPEQVRAGDLCKLGADTQPATDLIVGDSFAESLLPVMHDLALSNHAALYFASYNSCAPLKDIYFPAHPGYYRCREFNQAIMEFIKAQKIKKVMLVARWPAYLDTYYLNFKDEIVKDPTQRAEVLRGGLQATLDELRSQGIEIWLVKSQPTYGFNVPRRLIHDPDLTGSYADHQNRQAEIEKIYQQLTHTGVHFIDPAAVLCADGDTCLLQLDGTALYRDPHHLSFAGANYMKPLLQGFVTPQTVQ